MSKLFDNRKAILASRTTEDRNQAETDTNAHLPSINPLRPGRRTRAGLDDFEQGLISWLEDNAKYGEDLAMKTVCVAWEIRGRFTDSPSDAEKLHAWLKGILKNVARDEYRRRDNVTARNAVRQSSFVEPEGSEDDAFSPDEALDAYIHKNSSNHSGTDPDQVLIATQKFTAIFDLKPVIASVLTYVSMGWSFKEIGKALRLPVSTVASHVARGREQFRKQLATTGAF